MSRLQHARREAPSSTRASKFTVTGARISHFMDQVQRRVPSLSPARVLGSIYGSSRAASSASRPKALDPSAGPDSPASVKYSSCQPFATCQVVESWLVTAEERKRAGKMARKNRKFSLVKDADQLW
ncbi:hypothetical protein J3459_022265 [Metarhizium acridum]|uniref:uncharacterized protein n=1 Tax=Metarhizium acridum TaxID=92637 RepID=UPI001C6C2FE9|nr:hypothetical protein J3459_022265 [Metarhizium acridum]KAG8412915.1 hypothetical protein J3458_013337 [Metarhizium acridum]